MHIHVAETGTEERMLLDKVEDLLVGGELSLREVIQKRQEFSAMTDRAARKLALNEEVTGHDSLFEAADEMREALAKVVYPY